MWHRVTGLLVNDIARQRGGLILKGQDAHSSSNISTLGDETAKLARNVGRQSSGENGELKMTLRCTGVLISP